MTNYVTVRTTDTYVYLLSHLKFKAIGFFFSKIKIKDCTRMILFKDKTQRQKVHWIKHA